MSDYPKGAEYQSVDNPAVFYRYRDLHWHWINYEPESPAHSNSWKISEISAESIVASILEGNLVPVEVLPVKGSDASSMLTEAKDCLTNRASERDTESERSMKATVEAFNSMYNLNLSEEQGWMFMVFLKAARAKGGEFREDDYVDGAAYFALAGEAASESR